MNESKFQTFLLAAKETIGGEYFMGYQQGLRRFFHGEKFMLPAPVETLRGVPGERGEGFSAGLDGKPPRGMHANLGNLNAQGDLPADTQLQLRLNSAAKARYVKAAKRDGLKLSAWVIKHLDAAVDSSVDN